MTPHKMLRFTPADQVLSSDADLMIDADHIAAIGRIQHQNEMVTVIYLVGGGGFGWLVRTPVHAVANLVGQTSGEASA